MKRYFYDDEVGSCYIEECEDCRNKEDKIDICKEYLEKIVRQLYKSGELNVELLHSYMFSLCDEFDVDVPSTYPPIVSKKEMYFNLANDLIRKAI